MQQKNGMAALLAMVGTLLFGSAAGETFHPRLRSMQLKVHDLGGAIRADAKDQEVGSLALLEMLRAPASNATTELPSIDILESTLAELTADKQAGKATPGMENFANTVKKMIKDEMIPVIKQGDRDARKTLRNFQLGFRRCSNIRITSKASLKAMNLVKGSTSRNHKACRRVEHTMYVRKEACKKVVASKRKVRDAACTAFRALHRNPATEANKCHTTNVAEPYGLWLTRNRKFFQERHYAFKRAFALCRVTTIEHRRVKLPCDNKIQLWKHKRNGYTKTARNRKAIKVPGCVNLQNRLQTATCTLGKKMKDTCGKYDTCHDTQAALYRKQKPVLMTQEKDRKGEFRALKRIECLLVGVFGGPTVDTKAIDKCKATTHSTKWLDLTYPKVPDKLQCDVLPPIPGEPMFRVLEFKSLSRYTPPARVPECVLSPAGGILMGVEKYAAKKYKNYCKVSNGWLSARNGGSCLISERSGAPVQVNYKKARYTKFRFVMKMDEDSTRNAQREGGGFSMCNTAGVSWRSASPTIDFVDAKQPSQWGYKLATGWETNPIRSRSPVTCKQLMAKHKVWGKEARGIDLSKYTGGKMKWMGCMGDGCNAKDFFCTTNRDTIVFGATGTMRAVLGKNVPGPVKGKLGCGSRKNPSGMFNPMDRSRDINRLCRMMGYTRGTILLRRKQNFCPGVSASKRGWGSNFRVKTSYGSKFRCQGPMSQGLYTSKKYYKRAEPTMGKSVQWDLTMEYYKGKYSLKRLKIGGRSFSAYAGKIAKCSTRGSYAFAPRITSHAPRGKVFIKDFRVFQGNSLRTKKMKQVVGQGVGRISKRQKKKQLRRAVRNAERTFEVYRMIYLPLRKPTWATMDVQAKRRGGRLMTYAEAKLFIDKRNKKGLFQNRDFWAAVTNPRERKARGSRKKDWIQIGSRPHRAKTSHSQKFGYPAWGDKSKNSRGSSTTSVLLYVTKSRKKFVAKKFRVCRILMKRNKKVMSCKMKLKKVAVKVAKKVIKRKASRPIPVRKLIKKLIQKPRPRIYRRRVCHRRRKTVRRCRRFWFFGWRHRCHHRHVYYTQCRWHTYRR